MNRRSFLQLLGSAGIAVTLSPVLAKVVPLAAPPDKLTRKMGNIVMRTAKGIVFSLLNGRPDAYQLKLTWLDDTVDTIQILPDRAKMDKMLLTPVKDHPLGASHTVGWANTIVRLLPHGGTVELEHFDLSLDIPRSDGNYQGSLDRIETINLDPPMITVTYQEVSYS